MGIGNPPVLAEEEGEHVSDDELIAGEEPSRPAVLPRFSAPRISQRVPRSSHVPAESREGEILVERYRVERVLSRTPHEVVLEASQLELGQRVILRHLTALAASSPEAVARFQRGARKAREMRSEHSERVVDFGRLDSGSPYRAVELPQGPSLAEILRVRGALPVAEAVDIVITACEPVAEAHASGIVHRCLGTSNIYVERRSDGSPLVRVLDFGVSDPLEPDWVNGDEFATPGAGASADSLRYAAPEQIRNPSGVDARADVWALGAILYELLAGAPLFQAEGPLTLLAMIAADVPTPLGLLREDVPHDLEQLVLSCLEKDANARPRSVVEVVLALTAHASAESQPAATRVARIVMRTTRPPAMPSQPPFATSMSPNTQNRALVRTPPPPKNLETSAVRWDARNYGMLFAGAAIGLAAASIAPRLVAPAPAATAPVAPLPVVAAPATAALPTQAASVVTAPAATPTSAAVTPAVTPLGPTAPATVAAPPVLAAAPAAALPRAVAAVTPVVRAPAPSRSVPSTVEATHLALRTSALNSKPEAKVEAKPETKTASADQLFNGTD